MKILLIFIIATFLNVILSTVRSIFTVKPNKWLASLANAVSYGFYTWVVVLTVADFPLWEKIAITFIANFLGVFVVKAIEKKLHKDRLWKIEMAIPNEKSTEATNLLSEKDIPVMIIAQGGKWTMFSCYCATQKETEVCKNLCKICKGKISAYESQANL